MPPRYRPAERFSHLVVALLAAHALLRVANLVLFTSRLLDVDGVWLLLGPGLLGQVLVYLLAAVAFCGWAYRVSSNLHFFGLEDLQFAPAATIYWWLVPIANWFMPMQVMSELWSRNLPDAEDGDADALRVRSPVLAWWSTWILSHLLGPGLLSPPPRDDPRWIIGANVASALVSVIAAALAIRLVRGIQRFHTRKHAALLVSGRIFPPPRTF